jgi:hypothetical protein
LVPELEVALRLATNIDVDRKLRLASNSKYFWLYSLSLWDPEAFWQCFTGASAFAMVGLLLMRVTLVGFAPSTLTVMADLEFFALGLILMWLYHLGAWLHPANFKVILTLVFRLYRQNKTMNDLSAAEIGRLFPARRDRSTFTLAQRIQSSGIYVRIEDSHSFESLLTGSTFAILLSTLLWLTPLLSH